MCPHCKNKRVAKKGSFNLKNGRKVKRFTCNACRRTFSTQTTDPTCGEKKPYLNQFIFRLLDSGVSQRRCSEIVGVHPITIARKIKRFGPTARGVHAPKNLPPSVRCVVFDEMETFEHSKCKPLSILVAVDEDTRKILFTKVSSMPAKGHLAAIARKKYGYRPDHRARGLDLMMRELKKTYPHLSLLKSDESPRYPVHVRRYFPHAIHQTFKGRRGCVVGQGELKRGGWDPLFSLNHSCAMFRDNLKRLSRRTWCTTKDPKRLQDLVDCYSHYHNQKRSGVKRLVTI